MHNRCSGGMLAGMKNQFDSKSAIILGMHDALVSLTGLIAGLCFVFTDTSVIVISCIVSSITASLSMGAANYLAVKAANKENALRAACYTAGAYMTTCALLILPFFIFSNISFCLSISISASSISFLKFSSVSLKKELIKFLNVCFL